MCYIVFISHSLHWRYIKIALQEYVMICNTTIYFYAGQAFGSITVLFR